MIFLWRDAELSYLLVVVIYCQFVLLGISELDKQGQFFRFSGEQIVKWERQVLHQDCRGS